MNYLVKKKLIKRAVNKNDKREHIIQLTEKGEVLVPKIRKEMKDMTARAFKGFSKDEIEGYKASTISIIENMKNMPVNKIDIKIKK